MVHYNNYSLHYFGFCKHSFYFLHLCSINYVGSLFVEFVFFVFFYESYLFYKAIAVETSLANKYVEKLYNVMVAIVTGILVTQR